MNFKLMARINAYILVLESAFMIIPMMISVIGNERRSAWGFFFAILVTFGVGAVLWLITRNAQNRLRAREGMVCTGVSWILLSLFGALPFWFSRQIPRYLDAVFETVSGFTTTGASILNDVEAMSRGCLFWRSFTHWIGGMGILVFMLAVIPLSAKNEGFTLHLMRAESPGPSVGKIVPKMRETAKILYLIYIGLTALNVLFLTAGKMPLFDALCTAFGTAGTGGFGIKADSMAGYSTYLQAVTTVFMALFGVNFSCYYLLLRKDWKSVWKDEELRLYVAIILLSAFCITVNILPQSDSFYDAWHHAAFTVSSIITTTGFATKDFNQWPTFSKTVILTLMFCGACAGSTGGGIKVSRVLLLFKGLRRNIHQILHPQKVQTIRSNGRVISESILTNTNAYLSAYALIVILSFIAVSLDSRFSIESNFSAVMCCFNNIGPGLDQVGPTSNFYLCSGLTKIVLIMDMLLGRLEIFPILVLFSRSTWKKLN